MNEAVFQLMPALLRALPASGYWTQKQRDAWLTAATAIIDLLFEVIPNDE